jgi:hypothetical protein
MARSGGKKSGKTSAGKSVSRGGRKEGRAKNGPDAVKAAASTPAQHSGRNPLYVLSILVLLTVIVFLVNKLYFSGYDGSRKTTGGAGRAPVDDKKSGQTSLEEVNKPGVFDTGIKKPGDLFPEKDIKIYFIRFDEKTEKTALAFVKRRIKTDQPLAAALRELIKGPSARESRTGLLSALPKGLAVREVNIRKKIAVINFNEALEQGASGSIAQNRIDQIVHTATQFDDVQGVIIQMNGRTVRFLGGDGLALNPPLMKKDGGK